MSTKINRGCTQRRPDQRITRTSLAKGRIALLTHKRSATEMNCLGVLDNIAPVTESGVTAFASIQSLRLAMNPTSVGLQYSKKEAVVKRRGKNQDRKPRTRTRAGGA